MGRSGTCLAHGVASRGDCIDDEAPAPNLWGRITRRRYLLENTSASARGNDDRAAIIGAASGAVYRREPRGPLHRLRHACGFLVHPDIEIAAVDDITVDSAERAHPLRWRAPTAQLPGQHCTGHRGGLPASPARSTPSAGSNVARRPRRRTPNRPPSSVTGAEIGTFDISSTRRFRPRCSVTEAAR